MKLQKFFAVLAIFFLLLFSCVQEKTKENIVINEEKFPPHLIPGEILRYGNRLHSEGLIVVRGWDKKMFHLNLSGAPIYEERYTIVGNFKEGLAIAYDDGWCHIKKNGDPAYKKRYRHVGSFSEGLAVVETFEGELYHILPNGSPAYKERYNPQEHRILALWKMAFSEGLAAMKNGDGEGWFHIRKNGDPAYKKRYRHVGSFSEGLAPADNGKELGAFHIDRSGNPIYEERFRVVKSFYQGIALVLDKNFNAFFIDRTGRPIFGDKKWKFAWRSFREGMAAVVSENHGRRESYHINLTGNAAYEKRFKFVSSFFEGLAVVETFEGEWYHILPDGSPAYKERYRGAESFRNGIAVVEDSIGVSLIINKKGQIIK